MKDQCDWKLNQAVFQRILATMGMMEVDLFASRLSRQLPRFYSWRPDPEAEATDAFMQDWSTIRGFANPPWCLISRCLTKVRAQAARIVLITPLWPTQPWYPLVLELLEDYPRKIQQQQDLVSIPLGQEFIMQQGVPHGETKPIQTTDHHSLNGLAGVSNRIEIPCRRCSKFPS